MGLFSPRTYRWKLSASQTINWKMWDEGIIVLDLRRKTFTIYGSILFGLPPLLILRWYLSNEIGWLILKLKILIFLRKKLVISSFIRNINYYSTHVMKTIAFRKRLYLIWPDVRFDKKLLKHKLNYFFIYSSPRPYFNFMSVSTMKILPMVS